MMMLVLLAVSYLTAHAYSTIPPVCSSSALILPFPSAHSFYLPVFRLLGPFHHPICMHGCTCMHGCICMQVDTRLSEQLTDIVTDAVLAVRKEDQPIDLYMVRQEMDCTVV